MVDLLNERNDVAAYPTAETMVEVSRGRHLERWRLLVVERTQPFQAAAAGPLELQVLADDLVDLRPLADQRDVCSTDASPRRHQLIPPITAAVVASETAAVLRRLMTISSQSRKTWCSTGILASAVSVGRGDQLPVLPLSATCRPPTR